MNEDLFNSINGENTPEIAATPVTIPGASEKKGKSKLGLVALLFLAVFGIISAMIFAFLYFHKLHINETSIDNPNFVKPSEDETAVSDEATKTDIKNLINEMFMVDKTDSTIIIKDIDYPDVTLFQDGSLSLMDSINVTIKSLAEGDFSPLNEENTQSVISILSNLGYTDLDVTKITTVDGDLVSNQYKKIFSSDLDKTLITNGSYIYDATFNIFFNNPGVINTYDNTTYRYYYINKITEKEDSVYAYISAAQYDTTTGLIYCTVFNPYLEYIGNVDICDTVEEGGSFMLDGSNYTGYSVSRFEFQKDQENNYYLHGAKPAILE